MLLAAAGVLLTQAAATGERPASAGEAQPGGLAVSEVELAEGILAFEEGRDGDAAALLAEAVSADPRNGTARHWLGLAQLRLGRAAAAVASLTAALTAERPAAAGKRRVTADLAAARLAAGDLHAAPGPAGAVPAPLDLGSAPDCTPPPPRWEGRLSLEADYDSNPGLLPADATFLPLTGTRPAGTATDGGGDLGLRLEHHPFYDRGGWSLGIGVTGDRSAYRNQSDLDLTLAGGFAQLAWGKDSRGTLTGPLGVMRVPAGESPAAVLLQAGGTWVRLGAADYLRLAGGAGSLTLRGPGRSETRIDLGASQLRFAADLPGELRRSGSEVAAGIGESLFLGDGGGYLRAAASGGERQAGASFTYRFVEITAEAAAPQVGGWTFYLQAARRQERFANPQSNLTQPAGPARDDASWRGAAAALRMLSPHLACTAHAGFVRRDSNVTLPGKLPLFDYRRTTAGLGVTWFF